MNRRDQARAFGMTFITAVLGLGSAMPLSHAQTYPSKPIRLIVPNVPGGGTDTVARLIADKVSPALGQQIIVDNRGGAGGRIAAELVARSPKDGYMLMLGSAATLITGPALDADRKYDPVKDFAPITLAGTTAYILVTHPSLPVRSVRDLIGLAKASPGRIAYATTGQGGPAHLGTELFQALAQVKMIHVPYKGGAPAMLSLLQGETFVMISNFITSLPQVRNKRVRALGVTSLKRTSLAPDIPTIDESGLRGFELQQFYSVVAPAGVAAEVVQRLNQEIVQGLAAPDVKQRLAREGIELRTSTPAELGKLYAEQFAKWLKVIQQAGIKRSG
ncbi:MAG: tripartite tricarboxylate transporter substrate binding protein [Betaproteobacteria bacterium]|nr:tripartite tricarboxylate transporter substrate binding protein [Betaproteobacteria bacterium]